MEQPEYVDCCTAKQTLGMLCDVLDFFFPSQLRERFETIAAIFEIKPQDYWIERVNTQRVAISEAFEKLGGWIEMVDSELLMMTWSDEVFFFYVLRTQYVFARLAAKPDDIVPGTLEGFWKWGMTPGDNEMWMGFPVMTQRAMEIAKVKPPIWRIPFPVDYPGQG